MDKTDYFKKELGWIMDPGIRKFTESMVNLLPDYFFVIPASSTGKHHPAYAAGEGGLVRHTRAAVMFAKELFTLHKFNQNEMDIIISALILHDGCKHGLIKSKYSLHDHPKIMSTFILDHSDGFVSTLDSETFGAILDGIESHMGRWNTNNYSNVVLPCPETDVEEYIHLCDYLASRKFVEVKFDDETNGKPGEAKVMDGLFDKTVKNE